MNCFTTEKICVLSVDPKAAELFHHMQRRIEKALYGEYKSESTIGGANNIGYGIVTEPACGVTL